MEDICYNQVKFPFPVCYMTSHQTMILSVFCVLFRSEITDSKMLQRLICVLPNILQTNHFDDMFLQVILWEEIQNILHESVGNNTSIVSSC